MSKQDNLTDFLTDVADAIREKKGSSEKINPQNFSNEIRSIESGGEVNTFGDTMMSDNKGIMSVTTVVVNSDAARIDDYSFFGMRNLVNIYLGSINSIGSNAFRYCASLKMVQIPSSVNDIGQYSFANTGLQEITIPEGVTILREATFYNTPLATINMPDSLQTIGSWAFEQCAKLTSIDIPKNVNTINHGAFNGTGIKSMTIRAATPPTLIGTVPATTIYVPADSVEAYKSHTNWAKYADKILPISE